MIYVWHYALCDINENTNIVFRYVHIIAMAYLLAEVRMPWNHAMV